MKKYTCPMHPQVLKDEPGKCPLCGMALVPVGGSSVSHVQKSGHGHSGHSQHGHADENFNKHEGHHTGDFLTRFWISLVITIPYTAPVAHDTAMVRFLACFQWR